MKDETSRVVMVVVTSLVVPLIVFMMIVLVITTYEQLYISVAVLGLLSVVASKKLLSRAMFVEGFPLSFRDNMIVPGAIQNSITEEAERKDLAILFDLGPNDKHWFNFIITGDFEDVDQQDFYAERDVRTCMKDISLSPTKRHLLRELRDPYGTLLGYWIKKL